jgi:hypothetical protein
LGAEAGFRSLFFFSFFGGLLLPPSSAVSSPSLPFFGPAVGDAAARVALLLLMGCIFLPGALDKGPLKDE